MWLEDWGGGMHNILIAYTIEIHAHAKNSDLIEINRS